MKTKGQIKTKGQKKGKRPGSMKAFVKRRELFRMDKLSRIFPKKPGDGKTKRKKSLSREDFKFGVGEMALATIFQAH